MKDYVDFVSISFEDFERGLCEMRTLSMENRGFPMPFATFRRSILGFGNDKVHSMESNRYPVTQTTEFESFQTQVFNRFRDLSASNADDFLSFEWISKLLNAFVDCLEEFRVILCDNKARLSKSPLDKLISDLFERSIKALDICNATRDGIEKIRLWQKHLDMVLSALCSHHKNINEGMFRRARKALMDLALVMLMTRVLGQFFRIGIYLLDEIIRARISIIRCQGIQDLCLGVYPVLGQQQSNCNCLQAP